MSFTELLGYTSALPLALESPTSYSSMRHQSILLFYSLLPIDSHSLQILAAYHEHLCTTKFYY